MKKLLTLLLTTALLLSASVPSFANDLTSNDIITSTNTNIEYYDDGTYLVTTMETENNSTRSTINKYKSSSLHDNDGTTLWTVKLTATFNYNGTTATCTSASTSYTIYDDQWRVTSATASKSGNKATGNFTVKRYLLGIPIATKDVTVTLTCSPNGTVS